MRFNTTAFNRFIADIGQQVQWRRSYSCACMNPLTRQPDPKHALCSGTGRLWLDPAATVVGIARQETQQQWIQSGLYEAGDMVISIPSDSPMWTSAGQYDRITMLNGDDVFSQVLTRGGPGERLLFRPVTIERVFWLAPGDKNQLVEGSIPACSDTGVLSWPSGGGPPTGVSYSITGLKRPEYFIFDGFPSDRNQHSGVPLPKRIVARKWDLFGRSGIKPI